MFNTYILNHTFTYIQILFYFKKKKPHDTRICQRRGNLVMIIQTNQNQRETGNGKLVTSITRRVTNRAILVVAGKTINKSQSLRMSCKMDEILNICFVKWIRVVPTLFTIYLFPMIIVRERIVPRCKIFSRS